MKREFNGTPVWLSVISTGRPENVRRMKDLVGNASWYVRPSDVDTYKAESAKVSATEGLSAARNYALADAYIRGLICVQLDDDLRGLKIVPAVGEKGLPASFPDVMAHILNEFERSPYFLGGVSPTDNHFFVRVPVHRHAFVVGSLCLVKPTRLRFDEGFPLKEDYDYTCQHVLEYGGVCRVDSVLASFSHYTNSGGAVGDRSDALEKVAIDRLKAKWGPWIRDNPKRQNEVLLRLPKVERVVLS